MSVIERLLLPSSGWLPKIFSSEDRQRNLSKRVGILSLKKKICASFFRDKLNDYLKRTYTEQNIFVLHLHASPLNKDCVWLQKGSSYHGR